MQKEITKERAHKLAHDAWHYTEEASNDLRNLEQTIELAAMGASVVLGEPAAAAMWLIKEQVLNVRIKVDEAMSAMALSKDVR